MNGAQKKKTQEIANFIVNNITLAEVTTIVIERSTEYAELIVKHNLDPNNFNSAFSRRKLQKRLKELKEGTLPKQKKRLKKSDFHDTVQEEVNKNPTKKEPVLEKENISLYRKILKWWGVKEKAPDLPKKQSGSKKKSRSRFSTKK